MNTIQESETDLKYQKININKPWINCNNNKANANWIWRGVNEMSKNNSVVPQARAALDQFKMEAAREVGVQSPLEENLQHIERSTKT